jgi:hypothetical protein
MMHSVRATANGNLRLSGTLALYHPVELLADHHLPAVPGLDE